MCPNIRCDVFECIILGCKQRVCLNPKNLHQKTSHRMFGHMHEVLNRIYLQNFLHEWVVNREMNLISLLNL